MIECFDFNTSGNHQLIGYVLDILYELRVVLKSLAYKKSTLLRILCLFCIIFFLALNFAYAFLLFFLI